MADEKYVEIDMDSIKEIDGKLYAPVSRKNKLTGGKEVIPVFFAKTIQTEILHDSPTIGVWSYGKRSFTIDGPFLSDNEALSAIQKRAEHVDQIGYEFDSEVISKCYPSEQFPLSFKTYFERGMGIKADSRFRWYPEINGCHMLPEHVRPGGFTELFSQLPKLYQKITERLMAISDKHRMKDDALIAIIGNTYLKSKFTELRHGDCRQILIQTFSEKSENLNNILSKMFHDEGCYYFFDQIIPEHKYMIVSPGPKPSIGDDSIDDFVKAHDFIY